MLVVVKAPSLLIKVEKTKSEEWPKGSVDHVMEMLDNEFRPTDVMKWALHKQQLMVFKLKMAKILTKLKH